ncbi:MAG: hypothetical protein JST87_11060 [Bacteroidetes bacterium]|nr:hypothetical protein [Bacteroidota bacterium]
MLLIISVCFLIPFASKSQTDIDAIMMAKNNFCVGGMYGQSSWKNYWEGTFKRNNQNIGTVSTKMVSLMGNYGISNRLNVIVGAPYVWTHATAGTLHGIKGIQDLSLWLKWMPVEQKLGSGIFSVYTIGGFSTPLTNYIADYLPLSIGLHSTTFSGRLMADYQVDNWFATASGTYTYRNDITTDRTSYYTTEQVISNKIDMPDVFSYNFRAGYRSDRFIAEAVFDKMITLGGFDIRKNDMPFPSNKMIAEMLGVNGKYNFPWVAGLSLTGGASYTLHGRNVGQATMFNIGVFYILDFSKKAKSSSKTSKTN